MSDHSVEKKGQQASHDLNNHLAVIKLYAQLGLRHANLPDDLKEGFEVILGELEKIKRIRQSTERFRVLLSNLPGMAYQCHDEPGWPMEYVSEGCLPLTGYVPEELVKGGRLEYEDIIHPNDRQMVIRKVREGVDNGHPFVMEYRIITKDGTEKWVWEKGQEIIGPERNERWLEGFIIDITQRKKAQESLRESEEKYSVAFHSSPYAMIITRMNDGHILDVNHSFERISGFTGSEVIGANTLEINIWENSEDRRQVVRDLSNNIRVYSREYQFRRKDGGIRIGNYSADIITLHNEPFILSSFTDITDLKKIEEEQLRLREQLFQAQKMETVGRLAGGVAHEFNNALQIIKTYAELSRLKVEHTGEINDYLDQIITTTGHSSGMVSQLLAFARKQPVSPEVIDLNQIIGDMSRMLQRLVGSGIRLVLEPGEAVWPLRLDPSQLNQVIMNLVMNARDAIMESGTIVVRTGNETCTEECARRHEDVTPGDFVMLSVTDDGIGMDNQTLENIFEPFYTTKDRFKGTGLGLATVYGIVKQNKGFITVESREMEGTIFRLFFPRHT